jgi:hypothetical protein
MDVNTRYLGMVLILLSIVVFAIMYSFSVTMLQIIDSGQLGSCQSYDVCPHVMVLNQAYVGYMVSLIIFMIGLFLMLFGGKQPRAAGRESKWKDALKGMTGDDRTLYGKIAGSGGVMFQSELVEQSGFPKAKVSRILDRMEAGGLLERKRRGMANAVVLK